MTEIFDEDTGEFRKRTLTNGQVMAFIAQYWRRRPWLMAGTVGLTLLAIGFELMVPRASQALIDAALLGPKNVRGVWLAWLGFVGVYLAFSVVRNTAVRFWNPLAARSALTSMFCASSPLSVSFHAAPSTSAGLGKTVGEIKPRAAPPCQNSSSAAGSSHGKKPLPLKGFRMLRGAPCKGASFSFASEMAVI